MGGWTDERDADDDARAAFAAVAPEVGQKLGQDAGEAEVLRYASQVVAGRNYKLRVRLGDGKEAVVVVYQNLQGEHKLTSAEHAA